MDITVKQLIERFNSGTATPQERLELLHMVQAGQHTELFGDALEARILYFLERPHLLDISEQEEILATELERQSREKVYRHSAPTRTLTAYWRWAAAAAVLALMGTAFYFYKSDTTTRSIAAATTTPIVQSPAQPTLHTFVGRQWLHLPDGTSVLLNDNSHLQYDSTFNITTRTVTLTGEAFFDVKHDPSKPFHVLSGPIDTQVLGTAFNVKAYPNQKKITVVVARGRVRVSEAKDNNELAVITPKQQLSVNASDTRIFATKTVEPDKAIAWKKDFLLFEDMKLSEAAALITVRYGVKVDYRDTFGDCKIDAAFIHGETLDQVLTVISKVFHGNYTIENNQVTISGSCD